MNESKIIAAILTIAVSARETRGPSVEASMANWRNVIKDYERILAKLGRDLAKKAR